MKSLFFVLAIFFMFIGYMTYVYPNTPITHQDFIINRGDTAANIPKKLSIDTNLLLFRIYMRFFAEKMLLQAGTYSIEKDTTLKLLFNTVLKNPTSKDITIRLLPGWNIWDIDAYLAKEGIIRVNDFTTIAENISPELKKSFPYLATVTTLEGFLLPDTYRISPNSNADDIVKLLLKTFDERVYKEFNFTSTIQLYETLIFASILEKEEKSTINKPIVAGILKKRYDEKWFIGADATVCYAYRLTMRACTPTFIGDHIYEKTPYNTRNNMKLPPTPISNPSVETILSTIQSQSSKYYYYLHDNDGMIHYGKTLEDHNRNRVEYLGK